MKITEFQKTVGVLVIATGVVIISTLSVFGMMPVSSNPFKGTPVVKKQDFKFTEGPVLTPMVTVGPFDLHRRYRSMEGPYADMNIRMGDLAVCKNALVPESMVKFTEKSTEAPSMKGGPGSGDKISSLPDTAGTAPKLYWVKGFKLEVLDEKDKVMPTAEFICHLNIDVDPAERNRIFQEGQRCMNGRILTVTQGQTEISFPDGFAVPVASDEHWRFIFQAANRTTDEHRRVKHRLTLYMIPDRELVHPITPLAWSVPFIQVVIDKNSSTIAEKEKTECPTCLVSGRGVNAPNAVGTSVESDVFGRKVTGHWVVPPGEQTWNSLVREAGFADKPRLIHAVWSHVHPCCTAISLVKASPVERETIFTATCRTKVHPGLQIQDIDYIASTEGIPLPANNNYEVDITYNNPTDKALDSMATLGIFYEDNDWAHPNWCYEKDQGQFCGVTSHPQGSAGHATEVSKAIAANAQTAPLSPPAGPPIFDTRKDGPLLKAPRNIKVETSAGNLTFTLEPAWAPKTATQIAKLLQNHAYDGTEIFRYEPGFIFQVSLAASKAPGCAPITSSAEALIRRIPLEVDQQFAKQINHKPGVLSMARSDNDTLDNTTSFSILLGDSPHLDTKYTIFGKLSDDPENKATLEKMKAEWPKHPYIVKVAGS
jgi:cyclophilin family peptidyl-prolyl cis-trans isomerase